MVQGSEAVDVTRMSLRGDGWIGYTDHAVYIERDDEKIKIEEEHVEQLALRSLRWDLAVLGALLVGVGGYVAVTRNPLVGVAFAAFGAVTLYRTYGDRYELIIRVQNEPKPVTVHPTYPVECHETLVEHIGPAG
ncbi:hypothetical protein C475_21714 [Halosimplex carlsbadense 2-9-1]|uniref:Uncharacterized protein n=1 Tax=Halosimplex carlsbadense 2-9-1 TaxID=797114 RepID=M0CDL8_9EURY|nr:hypothetical protein [Halosimplex carlsbadense]ELZ19959.1 hypothetical protein C475_21714 [Halosimplex carlsbadense 2-9-1]